MKKEKRRFSRIPFKMNAELMVNNVAYSVDNINDLSMGGALLPIVGSFEAGTKCSVKIHLEGTSSELTIHVGGEILRCRDRSVAVKFNRIDPDSLFHLQNVIRYNSPDPDKIEKEINKHPGLF